MQLTWPAQTIRFQWSACSKSSEIKLIKKEFNGAYEMIVFGAVIVSVNESMTSGPAYMEGVYLRKEKVNPDTIELQCKWSDYGSTIIADFVCKHRSSCFVVNPCMH